MFGLSRVRRETPLDRRERNIAIASGLFVILANGIVGVAELWVPSGLAAVVLGGMPIWTMLFGWSFFSMARPTPQRFIGALIGLSGIAIIAMSDFKPIGNGSAGFGIAILFCSSFLWVFGSLMQRSVQGVKSALLFSGYQLVSGGLLVSLISLSFERPWLISPSSVSLRSVVALSYLIAFGSVIAFTAYSWLSRNAEPHLSSTYALVNPLIAVLLGWVIFAEPVTMRFLVATSLVIVGLSLMLMQRRRIQQKDLA